MKNRDSLQHFIIGGAQRCATTYLALALDAHPEIEFAKPLRPEPKFFLKPFNGENCFEAYRAKYFKLGPSATTKVFGEKSTSYIEYPSAADRIKATLPNVKLIFVLRDPIQRAISNYAFSKMNGYEEAPIDEALLREMSSPDQVVTGQEVEISTSPQAYIARSCYVDYLSYYHQHFDSSQIYICISEKLVRTKEEVESVYRFLGVDPSFQPADGFKRVNESDKKASDVPCAATIDKLSDVFHDKNQQLLKLFDVDISEWH